MSEKLSATATYIAEGRPLYDEEYVTFLLEQIDTLRAENERLRDENAICRDAIEHAVLLVEDWEAEHDDDIDAGAARATKRRLSEAIGKAVPRLLYEKPEGQRFYGLSWRELRAENERLRNLEKQVRALYNDADEWDCDGLGLHAPFDSWNPVLDALEAIDEARRVSDDSSA